jgi:predicted RNA-binding Zn-ribbon protein involved in translation (DUF1610 family)
VCLIGRAVTYVCEECGHDFVAVDDFDFGMMGVVITPVVCPTHGLDSADTGVNLVEGGSISEVERLQHFPCPECGKEVPRWDRKSCPSCGSVRLEQGDGIRFD